MILPELEDLDNMSMLVGNCLFSTLGPEARIQIIQLTNQCNLIEAVDNIGDDTTKIADWFRCSKLFEGL